MVLILQRLMGRGPGRSISAGNQTALSGPSTFKCETVGITSFTTSAEHHTMAILATVALANKAANEVFFVYLSLTVTPNNGNFERTIFFSEKQVVLCGLPPHKWITCILQIQYK